MWRIFCGLVQVIIIDFLTFFDVIFPIGNSNMSHHQKITPQEIGARAKAARKGLKLTQKALALTSGTGLRFIIELEQGKPTCQLGKTLTVLNTLGIKITLSLPTVVKD